MKSLTKTIIVLVVFNLAMGNLALAQAESKAEGAAEPTAQRRVRRPTPPKPPPTAETEPPSVEEPTPPAPPSRMGNPTISGRTGLAGVMMYGLPGNVVTDQNGYYTATVEHGWTGRVMPVKEGYKFEPASMTYTKVTTFRSNDNYAPKLITYIISGEVGVGGVLMKGLPGNPVVTGRDGTYQATVEYGWRGTVTPKKEGYAFEPPNLSYTHLMANLPNQNYSPRRVGPAPMLGRTGGRKVLVIPDTEVKPEELEAITQDLQVMSYILDEKFKEIREVEGLFVDFGDFFRRDSRDTEAIYLDGYGALFLMEVNFAFTPPPKAQEQELEETAEDVDPTWQRARQKMFSPEEPTMGRTRRIRSRKGDGAVELKQLSTELIKTLKHAANIRNLKQDEWVIFTVFGKSRQYGEFYEDYYRSAAPRSRTSGRRRSSSSEGGGLGGFGGSYSAAGGSVSYGGGYAGSSSSTGGYGGGMMGGMGMGRGMMGGMEYGETGSNSLTAMTVRAKKSDVDDFAKGKLDFEQFRQKVRHFVMY